MRVRVLFLTTWARYVVAICHHNLQFAFGSKLERGAGGRLLGEEVVGGARVEEGDAAELDAHLHRLAGSDAGDHVDRDLWAPSRGGRFVGRHGYGHTRTSRCN
jgi:hypothetical protein